MVELIGRGAESPTVLSDDHVWLEHPPPDDKLLPHSSIEKEVPQLLEASE